MFVAMYDIFSDRLRRDFRWRREAARQEAPGKNRNGTPTSGNGGLLFTKMMALIICKNWHGLFVNGGFLPWDGQAAAAVTGSGTGTTPWLPASVRADPSQHRDIDRGAAPEEVLVRGKVAQKVSSKGLPWGSGIVAPLSDAELQAVRMITHAAWREDRSQIAHCRHVRSISHKRTGTCHF
jgi:hypothetical protein